MVIVGVPCAKAEDSEFVTCRLVSGFTPMFLTSTVKGTSNAVGPTTVVAPACKPRPKLCGSTVWFTSVAVLFAGTGSVIPAGTDATTVLAMDAGAPAVSVAGTVNVAVPPGSRLTVVEILPVPPLTQDDPALATHVQFPNVSPAGAVLITVAPDTAAGPWLVTK